MHFVYILANFIDEVILANFIDEVALTVLPNDFMEFFTSGPPEWVEN